MSQAPMVGGAGPTQGADGVFSAPSTKLGRWSAGLAGVFVVMFLVNSFVIMRGSSEAAWLRLILITYGIAMLLCGLAAGITGLTAVIRQHERSWLVGWPCCPCCWCSSC
jgi:hypothetical protein